MIQSKSSVPHESNRIELSQIRIRFGSNQISLNLIRDSVESNWFDSWFDSIWVRFDPIRSDSVKFGSIRSIWLELIRFDSDSIRFYLIRIRFDPTESKKFGFESDSQIRIIESNWIESESIRESIRFDRIVCGTLSIILYIRYYY